MKAHFIGQDPKTGTSLAVRQFLSLVRGEIERHEPQNRDRVSQVIAEERYCFSCFSTRIHDVVCGSSDHILDVRLPRRTEFRIAYCRVCGKEGAL